MVYVCVLVVAVEGGLHVYFGRIHRVFSMRKNKTLKREDRNGSKYGSFVNEVFVIEKLVT